ncbi:hypothetical protein MTO96_033397 [Rhipicephalus appendiculatus]
MKRERRKTKERPCRECGDIPGYPLDENEFRPRFRFGCRSKLLQLAFPVAAATVRIATGLAVSLSNLPNSCGLGRSRKFGPGTKRRRDADHGTAENEKSRQREEGRS